MACPKCQGELDAKHFSTIQYHRCRDCGGIMMTPDMVRHAKHTIRAYEIMDVGSPRTGAKLNQMSEIQCPFCDGAPAMNAIQDAEQRHIWLEQCPQCERMFFDAGEFTDKHRETLWDKVLDLITPARNA